MMKFAKSLRQIIESRGLKLKTISEATGIPVSTISEWTAGREPKVSEALIKLAEFLEVSLDELILGKNFRKSQDNAVSESRIQIGGEIFSIKIQKINSQKK